MTHCKILIAIAVLASLLSCAEFAPDGGSVSPLTELVGESGLSYNVSFDHWTALKQQNGNSYRYQTSFTSWVGFGNVTEIEVENGVVISRTYREFEMDEQTGQSDTVEVYIENSVSIGTHQEGTEPVTIDELYTSCASDYLTVDQKTNKIYFETGDGGLMTLCGYVPNNCADDCFSGIRINAFDWIE